MSKIKIGLVLYTKVDCMDSGDFGNEVNVGGQWVQFMRQMPSIRMITIVAKNINTELTRMV